MLMSDRMTIRLAGSRRPTASNLPLAKNIDDFDITGAPINETPGERDDMYL
jgi:hypothetical protein